MESKMWNRHVRIRRLQLDLTIYRHVYPTTSDRIVIRPTITWDRRSK